MKWDRSLDFNSKYLLVRMTPEKGSTLGIILSGMFTKDYLKWDVYQGLTNEEDVRWDYPALKSLLKTIL